MPGTPSTSLIRPIVHRPIAGHRDPHLFAGVDPHDALGRLDRHARRGLDLDGASVLDRRRRATERRVGAIGT